MKRSVLIVVFWLGSVGSLAASSQNPDAPHLTIPRVDQPPALEEFLDMEPDDGQGLARVEGFVQRRPEDGQPASQRTLAYLGYDEKNFYAIFVCYDSEPNQIRARMSKREDVRGDERVTLVLDTFHDQRRAYVFAANPLGIQLDGLLAEGQGGGPRRRGDADWSFDTLWYSRGKRTDQGYVVWMAIPFKSLRFSSQARQVWGIAVGREIPRNSEESWWPYITDRVVGLLHQGAVLEGLENISPGRNLQFIPFGFFRSFRAVDTVNEPASFVRDRFDPELGLDAKAVLKDSLVLDVALNPDFSQVESDEPQVTVNQRFEVFFPEKRPFFLENSHYFGTPIDLVFTRRVADPQYGVRLTGKLGPYALGAFLIDDEAPGKGVATDDPLWGKRAFFGILRINRDLFGQSTLGFVFTDRKFENAYNRVGGFDTRLRLNPNWVLQAQALASASSFIEPEECRGAEVSRCAGPAYSVELNREGRSLFSSLEYRDFSPGFRAAAGFIRRVDLREVNQFMHYRYWHEGKHIINFGPRLRWSRLWDHAGVRQDWDVSPGFQVSLRRQTNFNVSYSAQRERYEGIDFYKRSYHVRMSSSWFSQASFSFDYDRGTAINYEPAAGLDYFLGDETNLDVGMHLRPFTSLRIDNTYIFSRLQERHTGANIFNNHIVRSKINYQFNRKLSLRIILQYDSVLPNPALTTLTRRKRFTNDFLITYLVNPGTALYIGYNDVLENLDPRLLMVDDELVRTRRRFLESGKQFFIKFSYLFRF